MITKKERKTTTKVIQVLPGFEWGTSALVIRGISTKTQAKLEQDFQENNIKTLKLW